MSPLLPNHLRLSCLGEVQGCQISGLRSGFNCPGIKVVVSLSRTYAAIPCLVRDDLWLSTAQSPALITRPIYITSNIRWMRSHWKPNRFQGQSKTRAGERKTSILRIPDRPRTDMAPLSRAKRDGPEKRK